MLGNLIKSQFSKWKVFFFLLNWGAATSVIIQTELWRLPSLLHCVNLSMISPLGNGWSSDIETNKLRGTQNERWNNKMRFGLGKKRKRKRNNVKKKAAAAAECFDEISFRLLSTRYQIKVQNWITTHFIWDNQIITIVLNALAFFVFSEQRTHSFFQVACLMHF